MKYFVNSLGYLLSIHVAALMFFFVFRFIQFLSIDYTFPAEIQNDWGLQAVAFVKGIWFDNVIVCYILIFPLVLLWITSLCNYTAKWIYLLLGGWFICFFSLAFVISAANIPYFAYFFKNINSSIFNWFEYVDTTVGMIVGESSYHVYILMGIISIVFWGIGVHYLSKMFWKWSVKYKGILQYKERSAILVVGAVCVGLCVLGARGRIKRRPLNVSQAYYCTDPFLNQLGINPAYYLLSSAMDDNKPENRYLELMPDSESVSLAQQLLNRKGIEEISPIAREIKQSIPLQKRNVVLVFMESMSAKLMSSFGQTKRLTPFLDSLYHESLSFNNIYSAGLHTNHGMYATLYSFPSILKRNAMKGSMVPNYSGLPTVLKDNGYHTMFFMTHESQYDNMNAFYRTNGFDEIYSEENYPKEKVVNKYGVQDDYLYQFALPILTDKAKTGQPFFAVLLSISNHPPYVVPSYFQPKNEKVEEQIVEYADWSLRKFMNDVREQPCFDNTIFVFIGDHGKLVGTPENELAESYNHVPLMFYGKDITPEQRNDFGGQMDVAPTILGMLGIDYVQNNFGIDLMKEQRPCIFYTVDDLIAARDSSRLYIYAPETKQEFYYEIQNGNYHSVSDNSEFEWMKNYSFSMLQSADYLIRQNRTIDYSPSSFWEK